MAIEGEQIERSCAACGFRSPARFRFCGECGQSLAASPEQPPATWSGQRERRQLTILFCDLAGSTSLSTRLDAEEFGEVISQYFSLCRATFERHRGYVDREEGDSLRVYFGYPHAHEDDAIRAVRAALEAAEAVHQLGHRLGTQLEVHVGIHTGEVVAGATPDGQRGSGPMVVGEVPNIAKRLEELAQPGTVCIGGTTHRLVAHAFACASIGAATLKGVATPVLAWRVQNDLRRAHALELFDGRGLTPLLGRDEELALLGGLWSRALEGQGQVVLLGGEPGIGKSRLVHAFLARLAQQPCTRLTTQCLEHFSNSAFFPFIELVQRELHFGDEDTVAQRISRLEAALAAHDLPGAGYLPYAASLLSLPGVGEMPAASSHVQRERTLEWLAGWILGGSEAMPVALVVEDLHWADASTLDLLTVLIDQLTARRALVLLTFRPEFVPAWREAAHITQRSLPRLLPEQARQMVQDLAGGSDVAPALLKRIAARSDGVPLFLEELTKMLLESGALAGKDAVQRAGADPNAVSIPETLRGSLAARLDHLSSAKPIAQVASVLGREFSYRLVQMVSEYDDPFLQRGLDRLVEAELLFARGEPPQSTYAFKHALVQETAYLSLLRPKRAHYHGRTAQVLVEQFAEIVELHPELAAHHFSCGGRIEEAVDYWHRAGVRAMSIANVEAAAHLRQALSRIADLPEGDSRREREIKCLISLGAALTATQGYAAPEVEQIFLRAYELCEEPGDADQRYAAITGLHTVYQVRGPLSRAVEMGESLVRIADARGDPLWQAQAHRCLGWSLFCTGRLAAAREHLEATFSLLNRERVAAHSRVHGAHPWVVGFVNCGLLEWFAGRPELATTRSRQGLELAREVREPIWMAYALCMSAAVHCHRREPERTLELAREAVAVSAEADLPYWTSWSTALLGWAQAHTGQMEEGLQQMQKGIEWYRDTGARLFEASSLALLAESQWHGGRLDEALRSIEAAFACPMVADDYFYTAELLRLKGALLLATGGDRREAEALTRRAIEVARAQGAVSLELRALEQLGRIKA